MAVRIGAREDVHTVTVILQAGLGNQMFQYALGRTLAQRRGTSLAMDLSWYKYDKLRKYSLGIFNITEKFATHPRRGLVRAVGQRLRLPGFSRNLGCLRIPGFDYVLSEKAFPFDPTVLDAPQDVYLEGWWQSEKYFKEIESVIRSEFCFKHEADARNRELGDRVKSLNSVCVHVRRTDYITTPRAAQVFGTCPVEYYRVAGQWITSQVVNPHFFVFSDEPDWAKANLEFKGPTTFVTQNSIGNDFEDLRLMTFCRHHIIANSSFSWWGAWLSNSQGIVIAPQRWFRSKDLDTRDLIPDRWIRL